MLSHTRRALEDFDNSHDFERMCSDILNSLGYQHVTPVAPRGGPDGGRDIEYTTIDNQRGLACVSLESDASRKFMKDLEKRKKGDYNEYILFSNQYITAKEKLDLARHCLNKLHAQCEIKDVEALRSLLDTALQNVREAYLHIPIEEEVNFTFRVVKLSKYSLDNRLVMAADSAILRINNSISNDMFNFSGIFEKSKEEKIALMKKYKQDLSIQAEKIKHIISFNIEMISSVKNDDVEVRVSIGEQTKSKFTFDNRLITPVSWPKLDKSYGYIDIPDMPYIKGVYRDNGDFYAQLIDNDRTVQCNIRTLNADQPKLLFDDTLYVSLLDMEEKLSLQVDVFSSKLKARKSYMLELDPKTAESLIVSDNS